MWLKGDRCLCGINVHIGTRIVAIWGLILHGISVILTAFTNYVKEDPIVSTSSSLAIYWIVIALNLSLLLGNLYKKPFLYWPYLLFMVCILLLSIIFVASVILFGSFAIFIGNSTKFEQHKLSLDFLINPQNATNIDLTKSSKLNEKMQMSLMLTVISAFLIASILFQSYLLSIVFRGYRFLKNLRTLNTPTNQLELYEQKY